MWLVLVLVVLLFLPTQAVPQQSPIMLVGDKADRCTVLEIRATSAEGLVAQLRKIARPIALTLHDPKRLCQEAEYVRIMLNDEPLLIIEVER